MVKFIQNKWIPCIHIHLELVISVIKYIIISTYCSISFLTLDYIIHITPEFHLEKKIARQKCYKNNFKDLITKRF